MEGRCGTVVSVSGQVREGSIIFPASLTHSPAECVTPIAWVLLLHWHCSAPTSSTQRIEHRSGYLKKTTFNDMTQFGNCNSNSNSECMARSGTECRLVQAMDWVLTWTTGWLKHQARTWERRARIFPLCWTPYPDKQLQLWMKLMCIVDSQLPYSDRYTTIQRK